MHTILYDGSGFFFFLITSPIKRVLNFINLFLFQYLHQYFQAVSNTKSASASEKQVSISLIRLDTHNKILLYIFIDIYIYIFTQITTYNIIIIGRNLIWIQRGEWTTNKEENGFSYFKPFRRLHWFRVFRTKHGFSSTALKNKFFFFIRKKRAMYTNGLYK